MTVQVLIAVFATFAIASIALLWQAFGARRKENDVARQRRIAEMAHENGFVTPGDVAEDLGVPVPEAERLLYAMVDDQNFTMGTNEQLGTVQFWLIGEVDQGQGPQS